MLLYSVLAAAFIGLGCAQKGPIYPAHTINQPLNHFLNSSRYPHNTDTFEQRYFFDSTHYKPGGPVFLYIGGETSGPSRFPNLQTGIIQILMHATNGLGVILENRYYGKSYPFPNSTTDNLVFLTTEQTIADNAFFAQNVKFEGISADLTAPNTPWIVYGGSLAGAQTAFTLKTYPDIMWGGISSSGTIKAKLGYEKWYAPIQKFGPQDCISSINHIVDKIDRLLALGNDMATLQLKKIFGLETVLDIRDFAQTIAWPLGGPFFYKTATWQELNWFPAYGSPDFFLFCSNVTNLNPPPEIAAVDSALAKYTDGEDWKHLGNYANYVKKNVIPICQTGNLNGPHCFGTQSAHYWSKTRNDEKRSYLYTSCIEAGAYQVAPARGKSLISRVIKTDYTQQWCTLAFPPGIFNSIPATPELERYNKYGGFNFKAKRLAFIDGTIDPWLDICFHSNEARERHYADDHPELLIAGAGHHWDSYGIKDINAEPQFIMQAHLFEIRTVQRWLKEFANQGPQRRGLGDAATV